IVLALTNSQDATTDFLESRLLRADMVWVRIDTDCLECTPVQLVISDASAATTISSNGETYRPADISSVYYRRPVRPSLGHITNPLERRWAQGEYISAWGGFLAQIPAARW